MFGQSWDEHSDPLSSILLFFQLQGSYLRKKGQRVLHVKQKSFLKGNIVGKFKQRMLQKHGKSEHLTYLWEVLCILNFHRPGKGISYFLTTFLPLSYNPVLVEQFKENRVVTEASREEQ